jgi:hypothetical protein
MQIQTAGRTIVTGNLLHWLAVCALVLGVLLHYKWSYRKRRLSFSNRRVIPHHEWHREFYAEADGAHIGLIQTILDAFAQEIGIDAGQLRPWDRLDKEFRLPHVLLDDSCEIYLQSLQAIARQHSKTIYIESHWQTLNDIIQGMTAQIFGQSVQQKEPGQETLRSTENGEHEKGSSH